MIYSAACAYAIRALCRLTMTNPKGRVLVEQLCHDADLPRHFVAKVLQTLVRRRILSSTKGRGGGFSLARPPHKITLYDIVAAIDGVEGFDECCVGITKCDDRQPCPLHDRWAPVRDHLERILKETTLADMSRSYAAKLSALEQMGFRSGEDL